MATGQKPIAEGSLAPSRVRVRRVLFAGIVIGCLLPIALAFFFGPKTSATYEDPLTGRRKRESIWLGLTLYTHIEENEVSRWADRNSNPGIYPAQFGWTGITSEGRGWFTGTWIACGGGFDIPNRIFQNEIVSEGLTREQTLQKYQAECVAEYQEHHTTVGTQKKWAARRSKS